MSKNQKKKLKKKQKDTKDEEGDSKEQTKVEPTSDLQSMLFKPQQDIQQFSIDELFKEEGVAKSLYKIDLPFSLKMKPSDLYERIKEVAQKRYSHNLPENQKDLGCLKDSSSKLAILRDICVKVGIKLLQGQKEFLLENNEQALRELITQKIKQEQEKSTNQKSSKKQKQ